MNRGTHYTYSTGGAISEGGAAAVLSITHIMHLHSLKHAKGLATLAVKLLLYKTIC